MQAESLYDIENEGPGIRVLPPVIFLVAVVTAFVAQWLMPISLLPDWLRFTAGPLLILASVAIMPSILRRFSKAETPFDVRKPATALVTDGPFRISRNPGYLAMVALCMGIALVADNLWLLILLVPTMLVLNRVVILPEEQHLEKRFGDAYQSYKARVRRWL